VAAHRGSVGARCRGASVVWPCWRRRNRLLRQNLRAAAMVGMDTPEGEEVLAADARRVAALVAKDLESVDALTAEDYTHVETNGGRRDKAGFLALLRQPDFRFVRWTIDENAVRVFGDVAVVSGSYRNVTRNAQGEQPEKHARHLRVWV